RALTRAVHTNLVPAGAFRGFGVPQAAIAQEQLYDELANRLSMDRLEFRILNVLNGETPTVTGQVLGEGVGIRACLEALRPRWLEARRETAEFNMNASGPLRRGVGVAGMWYGCGNTSLPNPSTMRIVEGLGSEVLPHPYHIPATPTPRRRGPLAFMLNSAVSLRASSHRGRKASKHARMPTPSPSTCPVTVGVSPFSTFRIRNSSRSIERRLASSS